MHGIKTKKRRIYFFPALLILDIELLISQGVYFSET